MTSGGIIGTPIPAASPVQSANPCHGRYAEVYDFAGFWCGAATLTGTHNGASGAAILTDSVADFIQQGVKAGQYLRNASDGSKTRITAVTATTIEGTLVGGNENDWDAGETYQVVMMTYAEAMAIETILNTAAADIHIAVKAAGACNCSMDEGSLAYLKKINVIDAAVIHNCPCGSVSRTWSDEIKIRWLDWVQEQLKMIISGDVELCSGHTGKAAPALGAAEINYGKFSEAEILWNRLMREGS